ncbi:Mlp family lipoprotein [Borreliella bavariensis]|uniref:Mlp family lipoprotein n=1 Tax=Borreliella bavariensis TaxID=664662 RepID=UPI001C00832C|nr:Mlp family lipoprotein [Borreliella bavariensis]
MKNKNILFCLFLIMLNGCNSNDNDTVKNNAKQSQSRKKRDSSQEELQQEKITLTPDEEKMFNSLLTAFKYTIEKLSNEIQGCLNDNKSKCTDFLDWLSTDIQKQKELANVFTTVYNFLKSKANDKDFDTYIKEAIDCKNQNQNQNNCNKENKYGNGDNAIEQYFRGITNQIFYKNGNEEIYQCLKEELLKPDSHYEGLTSNWNT